MTLKENGKISNKEKKNKQHKKYKDIKCSNKNCRAIIDVDYAISVVDIDYINDDKTKGVLYCPKCGESNMIKL